MSAAGLAELGLALPASQPAAAAAADVDMVDVAESLKEEVPATDLYTQLKEAQAELEFLRIQEQYIKDESKNLKRELLRAREEVREHLKLLLAELRRKTSASV
jgi:hypothetical protein